MNLGKYSTQEALNAMTDLYKKISESSESINPVNSVSDAKEIVNYSEKVSLNIEEKGIYRFESESTLDPDDNLVILPNNIHPNNPGRWVKINSKINSHENLSGFQGGKINEHYHLTKDQWERSTRYANNSQGGLLSAADWLRFSSAMGGGPGGTSGPHTHTADDITDGETYKMLTAAEKTKLAGIETGANNYIHPSSHTADIITQDNMHRFVTDTQIVAWNNKVNLGVTEDTAFRGDYGDVAYVHSQITHAPYNATKNDTDANLKNRANHTGTQSADTIVDGTNNKVFTSTLLTKLNGIESSANNYVHPTNHDASIITQDLNNRFVTDAQITTWNGKSNLTLGTTSTTAYRGDYGNIAYNHSQLSHAPVGATVNDTDDNLKNRANHTGTQSADTMVDGTTNKVFTSTLLTKLNGISAGANNYSHPANHAPSIITQDASNRFVTDTQISTWDGKSNLTLGTTSATAFRGDYGNTAYTHSQASHAPVGATVNDTDANLKNRANHTGTQSADTITDGTTNKVFTSTLLTKLSNIADNANNYSHPANHSPSIITQDVNNRFVTDTQISTWNGKSDLVLGNLSTNAYYGDKGKTAYDHSQATHASVDAQKNSDITKAEIEAKLTGAITSHTHSYLSSTHDASGVTSAKITNWDASYTHSQASHAPTTAQKNSDITKAEIEAKLTGAITSHTHAETHPILYGTGDPPAGQTTGTIYFKI